MATIGYWLPRYVLFSGTRFEASRVLRCIAYENGAGGNGMDSMEYIFGVVGQKLPAAGVEFLMIGGHAVNHIVHLAVEHGLDLKADLKPLCDRFADQPIYQKLVEKIAEQADA